MGSQACDSMTPIAFWKTRSFWALVVAIVAPIIAPDLESEAQSQIVDFVVSVIPVAAMAVAYWQRMNPSRSIGLRG